MSYMECSNRFVELAQERDMNAASETRDTLVATLNPLHVYITVTSDARVLLEYDNTNPIAEEEADMILAACRG